METHYVSGVAKLIIATSAKARSSLCGGATEAAQTSPQRPRSLFNETSQGPCECTQRGAAQSDGQCHRGHANYVFSESPPTPLALLHVYPPPHASPPPPCPDIE